MFRLFEGVLEIISSNVSKTINQMGKIKGKNTKLEQSISKALWKNGLRYRKNVLSLYGKPDIAIKKYKIVIFVDSCFWHGCSNHFKLPKKNPGYWSEKINRNIERDFEVSKYYSENEWVLIRVWEHDLKNHFDLIIYHITKIIIMTKHNYFLKCVVKNKENVI